MGMPFRRYKCNFIQDNASDIPLDTLFQQYSISNATSIKGGDGGLTSGTATVTEADGGNGIQVGLIDPGRFMVGSDTLEIVNSILEEEMEVL